MDWSWCRELFGLADPLPDLKWLKLVPTPCVALCLPGVLSITRRYSWHYIATVIKYLIDVKPS
jgi:hypothetical protein